MDGLRWLEGPEGLDRQQPQVVVHVRTGNPARHLDPAQAAAVCEEDLVLRREVHLLPTELLAEPLLKRRAEGPFDLRREAALAEPRRHHADGLADRRLAGEAG